MKIAVQSLPSRQLHLLPGSPMNGVLEECGLVAAERSPQDVPLAPAVQPDSTQNLLPGRGWVRGTCQTRFVESSSPHLTFDSLRSPSGQPAAVYLRCAPVPRNSSNQSAISPAGRGTKQLAEQRGSVLECAGPPALLKAWSGAPEPTSSKSKVVISSSLFVDSALRRKRQRTGALQNASRLAACLVFAMLSTSCGKKEAPKTSTEAPKPAAVSDAKIDAVIADALTPSEPSAPSKSEVQSGLEAQAEDILAKYPNKNAQDILNVPEVNEALKAGLTKLSKDKNLQDQINNSVALAAKMKGLSGEPGTVGLDLDTQNYDHSRKSRMLQAVISEDPKQIVRFLTEEIGEAVPELTLGGAERATNGISIKETTPAAK
jgi:hypothetical protein